jgi:hypothetical protein
MRNRGIVTTQVRNGKGEIRVERRNEDREKWGPVERGNTSLTAS